MSTEHHGAKSEPPSFLDGSRGVSVEGDSTASRDKFLEEVWGTVCPDCGPDDAAETLAEVRRLVEQSKDHAAALAQATAAHDSRQLTKTELIARIADDSLKLEALVGAPLPQRLAVELAEANERLLELERIARHNRDGFEEYERKYYLEVNKVEELTEQLADANRELAARDGVWKPIETAPKDGTRILLFIDANKMIGIGWWHESSARFGDVIGFFHQPTHWQPLPAQPTAPPAS